MSRTLKERLSSRDGFIAAWVCTALAFGGVVAMALIIEGRGIDPVGAWLNLVWLLLGLVAAAAVVFALMARRSYPDKIAPVVPVVLAGPLAFVVGGVAMALIGLDIYYP